MKFINHEIFKYVYKLDKNKERYRQLQRIIVDYPVDSLEILENLELKKLLKGNKYDTNYNRRKKSNS